MSGFIDFEIGRPVYGKGTLGQSMVSNRLDGIMKNWVYRLAAWLAGYFIDEFISCDDPMGLRIVLPVIVMGCCIMKFIKDSNQPK